MYELGSLLFMGLWALAIEVQTRREAKRWVEVKSDEANGSQGRRGSAL